MSHPDSLARRPIDPAMGNSFGSYSEPGTRNSCQAEASPMVRDDDVGTPELRRRRSEGVGSHINIFCVTPYVTPPVTVLEAAIWVKWL